MYANPLWQQTATYNSEGWTGQESVEYFKLLTVSTMCKIDGIVESYEMGGKEIVTLPEGPVLSATA